MEIAFERKHEGTRTSGIMRLQMRKIRSRWMINIQCESDSQI